MKQLVADRLSQYGGVLDEASSAWPVLQLVDEVVQTCIGRSGTSQILVLPRVKKGQG